MTMSPHKKNMLELVQAQLNAYNKGDIDSFCRCYHAEVEAFAIDDKAPFIKGIEELRMRYAKRFEDNPKLHCELRSRVVLENSVLDEEWVTGVEGADKPSHVVAIYHFKDGLIKKIHFTH